MSINAMHAMHAMHAMRAMHAKPDLRVVLEWMIAGSGSVIAAVIRLEFAFKKCP